MTNYFDHFDTDLVRRLVTLDGTVLLARKVGLVIEGAFVWRWILENADDVARLGRKFIPCGEKSRIQKQLGIREQLMTRADARALEIKATGLPVPVKRAEK